MASEVKFLASYGFFHKIAMALILLVSLLCFGSTELLAEEQAALLYKEKCAGCHTIGGGNLVGPDLNQSAKWGSADLSKAIKAMEKNVGPLTDQEVESLASYIKAAGASSPPGGSKTADTDGASKASVTTNPAEPSVAQAAGVKPVSEPASSLKGKQLFSGAEAFKNEGLSCIACHQVDHSGGTMGPDLTGIAERMSESSLVSACEHTPYKVMKTAYRDHPIKHQEALDLAAYLNSLKASHQQLKDAPVSLIGFAIAAFIMGIIAFGYRRRNTSVRAKLQRRN